MALVKKIEQVAKKIFIPAGQGGRMKKLVSGAGLVAFLVARWSTSFPGGYASVGNAECAKELA